MKKSFMVLALALGLLIAPLSAAKLTVIHGIPGDSVADTLPRALPVDIYVNQDYSAPALAGFTFGQAVEGLELPGGEYTIEIFLAGSDPEAEDAAPVLSATATLADEGNYSALAHLTYSGEAPGIALSLFENESAPVDSWESRITARHLANAPTVTFEIRRNRFLPFVKVPGFSNGDEAVLDILTGNVEVNLLAGGSPVFSTGRLQLLRGKHYAAYAIGDFFKGSFQVYLQVIQ